MKQEDPKDYAHCAMCGVSALEKELSFEPTRSQLLFGGFRARMEHRCSDCEKKVCDSISKLLEPRSMGTR